MSTFKQLEAFHWIVKLRTFDRAARRLNTTQSAISKRILELETGTGLTIFDRSQRGVRLTIQGEKLLALANEAMDLQRRIASVRDDTAFPPRSINIGVTELSALTWLPRLVSEFRQRYVPMTVRPEIGKSRGLLEGLDSGALDLIVVPEMPAPADIRTVTLCSVANAFLATPSLVRGRHELTPQELLSHPILMQERSSIYSSTLTNWLRGQGVIANEILISNSLTALIGLTVASLGISFLPRSCLQHLIDDGTVIELATAPPAPSIPYVVMYREESASTLTSELISLLENVCDFTRRLTT